MNEAMTDEELDAALGTTTQKFSGYKVLSVDNGEDIVGTNATGDYVYKEQKDGKTVRVPYSDVFHGVILSAQAQLIDKAKSPTWRTGEFDASDKNAQIPIYQVVNGQMVKDPATNQYKVQFATYDEIKKSRRLPQPDGTFQSTYNYFVVLYIGVGEEIVKLKFKGAGRSNFFDYSKEVGKMGAKLYNIMTEFAIVVDKGTGKFAAHFSVADGPGGAPASVDADFVRKQRIEVANGFMRFKNVLLGAPKQGDYLPPAPASTPAKLGKDYEGIPTIPGKDDAAEKPINISDVPFA